MVAQALELLDPREGGIYVDGTLGLGGHARAILERIGKDGRLVGIDRDQSSLELARKNLDGFLEQCLFFHDHFCNMDGVLNTAHLGKVDGILLDLGISSFQLDDQARGFSFQKEGPLDMRMDRDDPLTAADIVNSSSEQEIAEILRDYGEEKFHRRIARSIVQRRSLAPFRTTEELKDIVQKAMPAGWQRGKIHPATRAFQAFRIAVNRELEEVATGLDKAPAFLKEDGRLVVIAFHSLEDRIVKEKFRHFSRMGTMEILTKKPLRPSEQEEKENTRARSARLRGARRL
jgi:16S rRNA (cytosine1402-N4)-methyltransferase